MPYTDHSSRIRTRENFIAELKREIARVRRYGHRITLLLIEPEEELEDIRLQEFKTQFCSQLRTSDYGFRFDDKRFAAILPDTHEAGGEAAALRIKRRICALMAKKGLVPPPALSIGVVSLDSGVSKDIQGLMTDLLKDLERDKKCQAVDLKKIGEKESPRGTVLFAGINYKFVELISSICGEEYAIDRTEPQNLIKNLAKNKIKPVVILGMDILLDDKRSITKKIRFNRELNKTYIIWLQDDIKFEELDRNFSCDMLLPENVEPKVLWPVIRHGFQIVTLKKGCGDTDRFKGMLDSIGAAAHQLNQPLQIILGRLELFMLNMDNEQESESILDDIKTMRRQALLAADINKKIGRLTKYDLNTGE